jgi:hypothetical protein
MTATKELISEIETLPKEYLAEVFDFVAFLNLRQRYSPPPKGLTRQGRRYGLGEVHSG